jgi:hypothetical protein
VRKWRIKHRISVHLLSVHEENELGAGVRHLEILHAAHKSFCRLHFATRGGRHFSVLLIQKQQEGIDCFPTFKLEKG